MSGRCRVACLQFTAGREIAPNLAILTEMVREAAGAGANFILTPETSDMLEPKRALQAEKLRLEEDHAGVAAFCQLAAELDVWLLAGSFLIKQAAGKPANRSFLFAPSGEVAARYDKIHMFDVSIPDGQSYRESNAYQAGGKAVLTPLPWGPLGMTICYDLRFPALYRSLAQAGALFLTVPSAFTRLTGEAHWHCLLRARAIENGAYVLAPAQWGTHAEGRQTYGHSLIVGPWGEVLADGGEGAGIIYADLDPEAARRARQMIPSLAGDRDFSTAALS